MQSFEQWYYGVPPVTRIYLTLAIITSISCRLGLVSQLNLYYSWALVWQEKQWWRLFTSFLFLGREPFNFFIRSSIVFQHGRSLEEGYFNTRKADYLWFFLLGAVSSLVISTFVSGKTSILFLSPCLSSILIYMWSRVCSTHVSILGFFIIPSHFVPWITVAIKLLVEREVPLNSLIGIFLGHTYYYFDYVYPKIKGSRGKRPLEAPVYLKRLFSTHAAN